MRSQMLNRPHDEGKNGHEQQQKQNICSKFFHNINIVVAPRFSRLARYNVPK